MPILTVKEAINQALVESFTNDINVILMGEDIAGGKGREQYQGTQDAWLKGKYHAANPDYGLPDPEFTKIAEAYGINTIKIENQANLADTLKAVFKQTGPCLIEVSLKQGAQLYPKVLFGRPIEDSHPLLPIEELKENMIIDIIER